MKIVFMVNISHAKRVFKILLVLLAFAITLKGINTIRGSSKDKKKSSCDLRSPEGKASDIKLIHIMSTDSL